jgi:uncharacterized protein (DUF169 family)
VENARELQMLVGGRWHGVTIFKDGDTPPGDVEFRQTDRFCEAVELASVHKALVRPTEFTCPGARFAFGGVVDSKELLLDKMIAQKGYPAAYANQLFESTPHLQSVPEMIGFNCTDEPDIVIAQLQPEQVMRLIQLYHIRLGKAPRMELSSIVSACGNTAVNAYLNQDLALSFGCDDSRAFGDLTRDRLYAGLPYSLAKELIR